MSRSRIGGLLIAAALIGAPTMASAQITIGPVLAYEPDIEFGIGASLGTSLANQLGEGFGLLADVIIFFPPGDGFSYFEINGNATYDFPLDNSSAVPFLLGGLNIARASVEVLGVSGSSTDVGLNLGGGIDFDLGNFRPTAGVRAEVGGGEGVIFFVTLPFQTGDG